MTELVATPEYTFPSGETVTLRPVPSLLLVDVMANNRGKPQPPKVEFTRRGRKVTEENPNDPKYLESLEEWRNEKNARVMRVSFLEGVIDEPSDKLDKKEMAALERRANRAYGDYTEDDLKYIWLVGLATDEEILGDFQEAITSLSTATVEGREESEQFLPSDD
jgi:hypothetical protein